MSKIVDLTYYQKHKDLILNKEYGKNRYMSEEKKQRLKEYQKNYYKTKRSQYSSK